MKILTLRRLTQDLNHNAFTGATFFKGALYVAFRQGDAHVCDEGRIVILRSRDEGRSFDTVAVIRGEFDTRDAHLYVAGERLYVVGFEAKPDIGFWNSGCAWSDNGLNWSPFTRYTGKGVEKLVFWRPRSYAGRHYCAAYDFHSVKNQSFVRWFEGTDGVHWEPAGEVHGGADQPNECYLQFKPDGTAVMIMRREHDSRKPILATARPPYREWTKTELDIPLAGPALWLVGEEIWISGRWFPTPDVAHLAIFHLDAGKPVLRMVLPSGPGFDCSYMGVAQHPINKRRFFLSYYSNHDAPGDPTVSQWDHPDIYLAEAVFDAAFIKDWKLSKRLEGVTLGSMPAPDPGDASMQWRPVRAGEPVKRTEPNFVDARASIQDKPGVVCFVADIEVGPTDRGSIHLGFDGPVKAWLNGQVIYEGPGSNPALPDKVSVAVTFRHGSNRLAVALDSNGGKAWGIFGRFDTQA